MFEWLSNWWGCIPEAGQVGCALLIMLYVIVSMIVYTEDCRQWYKPLWALPAVGVAWIFLLSIVGMACYGLWEAISCAM